MDSSCSHIKEICTKLGLQKELATYMHMYAVNTVIEAPPVSLFHYVYMYLLCSGVDLPFNWQFYHPVGVPLHSSPPDHEDVPVIKQLIPTTERLFSVQPPTGVLQAGQSKNFIYQFLPQKVSAHTTVKLHQCLLLYTYRLYLFARLGDTTCCMSRSKGFKLGQVHVRTCMH